MIRLAWVEKMVSKVGENAEQWWMVEKMVSKVGENVEQE